MEQSFKMRENWGCSWAEAGRVYWLVVVAAQETEWECWEVSRALNQPREGHRVLVSLQANPDSKNKYGELGKRLHGPEEPSLHHMRNRACTICGTMPAPRAEQCLYHMRNRVCTTCGAMPAPRVEQCLYHVRNRACTTSACPEAGLIGNILFQSLWETQSKDWF